MEIIRFFKRIWNYLFPEKKKDAEFKEALRKYNQETIDRLKDSPIFKPAPQKEITASKSHSQLFRKHQLPGKVYNVGKLRFRIRKKIGDMGEKLKYDIDII